MAPARRSAIMKDVIDIRDEKERISRSIIKSWNVNYVPRPVVEPEPEAEPGESEAAAGADGSLSGELSDAAENPEDYNASTGAYSGAYGKEPVRDEVTKGQIDKILSEKSEALRGIIEQSGGN